MILYAYSGLAAILFVALTLNGFYILNEETLVALTFFTFIIIASDAISNMLKSSLEEKAELLNKEFDFFFEMKEKSLIVLIEYYKKQLSISKDLTIFFNYSNELIQKLITSKQKLLLDRCIEQQQIKFVTLQLKEQNLLDELQDQILSVANIQVLNSLTDEMKEQFLQEQIKTIKSL